MRILLLALCFLFPASTYSAAAAKLSFGEYSSEVKRLAAECLAKNLSHLSGLCISQKYDELTATALSVALALHRFNLYLGRCEHSDVPNWKATQNRTFNIAQVKTFYEEMASQTEALDIYSRYANICSTLAENDIEVAKRLRWFADMAARHSDDAKARAVQAQMEHRKLQSLAEVGLRELDPWFVGKFSGYFPSKNGTGRWSLKCAMGEECLLTMSAPNSLPQSIPMRVPIRREVIIPNNNLGGAREAVRERPELYEDKTEGPMLVPLRDLLSSRSTFERCVDIATGGDVSLCSLTTDPRASKSLVLLIGTMKGSCGNSPFCAYYFQVLIRESED